MGESAVVGIRKGMSGKRGVSFCFLSASLVCTLLSLALYAATGRNSFTPALSGTVLTMLCVCAALGALLCVFEVRNGKYVLYLLLFWSWLKLLVYNASYISNVLVGIDGNQFSPGFLLTVLSGLLAWLAALVSAVRQKSEYGGEEA